ncbi:MAG: response regulator [Bdellovibrionota bacterium]
MPATFRVLVVDDSESTRQLLQKALAQIPGLETVGATDGVDALQKLREGRFDLVITDLEMPLLDGMRLITRIHQRLECRGLPIIALTGATKTYDPQAATDIGAVACITKPLKASELLREVRQALGIKETTPSSLAAPKTVEKLERILVCDDDAMLLRLLNTFLHDQFGSEVRLASNGREALKKLDEFDPQILVLDYMMPKMNGVEVLSAIRERTRTGKKRPKVLVYSALNIQKEAMARGADAFLQKPGTVENIRKAIAQLLEAPPPMH